MSSNLGIRSGWVGVLVVAMASAGGCDRRSGAATSASTQPGDTERVVTVQDAAGVKETDPSKLLFRYLVVKIDPAQVEKILRANPALVDKPINDVRPIWMACEAGSLPLVQAVAERGADLKSRNKRHQTLLWTAVERDNLDLVKFLIAKGLDPKDFQEDDETLLWAAASKKMAQFLVDAGVDPKHKSKLDDYAIHNACRESRKDVVEFLLDQGIDIELRGRWNMPPLHSAVSTMTGDSKPVVLMLLKRGAKVDSHGFEGHTVLHECAFYNRVAMADLLFTFDAQVDWTDDKGQTPMDLLILAGKIDRIAMHNLLIRHGAPGQPIPLPKE